MMQSQKPNDPTDFTLDIPEVSAERLLGSEVQLKTLQNHLLRWKGARHPKISFCHQSLQEYYAAEYLLQLLPELSDEQLKRDYLNLLKWTEPIALMLALVDEEQALRVVKLAIDDVDLMLGARLAGEVKPHIRLKSLKLVENLQVHQKLKLKLLGMTRLEEAISILKSYLNHLDYGLSYSAVVSLQLIGSESTLKILGINPADILVEDPTDNLDNTFFPSGSDLREAKESTDPHIRAKVADILGQVKTHTSLDILLEILKDSDAWVRCCAAASLGEIKFKEAVQPLIDALTHDPVETVRGNAAYSLGIIGSTVAENSLIQSLDDDSSYVQRHASYALGKINGSQAISVLLSRLKSLNYRIRGDAARALGFTRSSVVKFPLVEALKDEYYDVRESAVKALGYIGSEDIFEVLEKVFLDEHYEGIRESAATALADINISRAEAVMIHALTHRYAGIRHVAAHVLQYVGKSASVQQLIAALDDSNQAVRATAARALDSVGTASTLSVLTRKVKINGEQSLLYTISAIQNRSAFYNYEIWQESIENLESETQDKEEASVTGQTTNVFPNATEVKVFERVDRYYENPPFTQEPPP